MNRMLRAWDGVPYPEPRRSFAQRLVTAAYVVGGALALLVGVWGFCLSVLLFG